jgi:hypothetical protein
VALNVGINASSGSTLFVTLTRLSDSFWWNQSATAWQANPAAADRKVAMTEGTGAYAGSFSASVTGLGDAGFVRFYIHDDADPDDAVVSGGQAYIVGGNEVDPNVLADALLDRTDGVETGVTPREYFRRTGALLTGVVTGAGTGTEKFAAMGNSGTHRATITVDDDGNRSVITFS